MHRKSSSGRTAKTWSAHEVGLFTILRQNCTSARWNQVCTLIIEKVGSLICVAAAGRGSVGVEDMSIVLRGEGEACISLGSPV